MKTQSAQDHIGDLVREFAERMAQHHATADQSANLMSRIRRMATPLGPDLDRAFAGAHPDDLALLQSFPSVDTDRGRTDTSVLAVVDTALACTDRRRALSLLGWAIVAAQSPVTTAVIETWWDASPATAWLYHAAGFTPEEVRAGTVPPVDEVRALAAWRGVTVPPVRPLP